jgi:hypothetical protein
MLPALAADASLHICGVRAVFEVVAAGCHQGGLDCDDPPELLIRLSA